MYHDNENVDIKVNHGANCVYVFYYFGDIYNFVFIITDQFIMMV